MIRHCKQLKSFRVAGGEVRRRLASIGGVPVVLFSKSHPILRPCFTKERWQELTDIPDLPVELIREVDQWNRSLRFSYNCHAMSISGLVGMATDDWVEGSSSVFTVMSNPMQSVLDAHFFRVKSNLDPMDDEFTMQMQAGDVLVFRDTETGDLVHSGRIQLVRREPYLMSKLGEYPAAILSVAIIAEEYRGQYDSIDLYRLR